MVSKFSLASGLKKQLIITMKFKKFNPLISIIMNCHNGENYLKQSLKKNLNLIKIGN